MLDLLRHFPNTTGYGRTAIGFSADAVAGADRTADAGPARAIADGSPSVTRAGGAADFAGSDVCAGTGAAGASEPRAVGPADFAVGDAEGRNRDSGAGCYPRRGSNPDAGSDR